MNRARRAVAAGATLLNEPSDQFYGERLYSADQMRELLAGDELVDQ